MEIPSELKGDDEAIKFYKAHIKEIGDKCKLTFIVFCKHYSYLMRAEQGTTAHAKATSQFIAFAKAFMLTPFSNRVRPFNSGLETYQPETADEEDSFFDK